MIGKQGMGALAHLLKKLWSREEGNFAIIGAIAMVPLVLAAGLAVDYSRHSSAYHQVQSVADIAALALAASEETDPEKLLASADPYIFSNASARLQNIRVTDAIIGEQKVELTVHGELPVTFMGIAGYKTLTVSAHAAAEKASRYGQVEVALVLDNTWSMSEADDKGVSRLAALKKAARDLVDDLLITKDGSVRIALVPYADYVNVGTAYRHSSWLSVPADYEVTTDQTCQTLTTKTVCTQRAPKYSCTKYVDGVPEESTCGNECLQQETQTVAPYQSCSGGKTTYYKWFGCIGSRMPSTTRLHDQNPGTPYPGYVETSQKCLNPLMRLTADKGSLISAINGMIINIGSYKPYTYIPTGLIWGLNTISPNLPFADGLPYDPDNTKPRKVVVLMTDGENTLRFRSSDGRHISLSTNATTGATQKAQSDADTLAVCNYIKSRGIEIFTVAFMVDEGPGKTMLRNCASSVDHHFFDANEAAKLTASFKSIAQSLRLVRLVK